MSFKSLSLITNGGLFVDFFFVLSGFVIASSYGRKLSTGFSLLAFMLLRLGRLYPLHFFLLALYVPPALSKTNYSITDFIDSAFLLQAWTPYSWPEHVNPWNPPSWSISAEVWMYLLFAIVCSVSNRISVGIFSALAATAFFGLLIFHGPSLDSCFSGLGFLRCVFGFSFGVIAFLLWRDFNTPNLSRASYSIAEVIILILCAILVSYSDGAIALLCPPLFAMTVLIFAAQRGLISTLLRTKIFICLGAWSYSIYMTHEFVMARFYNLVSVASRYVPLPFFVSSNGFGMESTIKFGSDIGAVMLYVSVLAFSYFTFTFVETPFRNWSRSISGRRISYTETADEPA